jgi:hypothetical protein
MLVLAAHAAWICAYLAAGHEARDFAKVGFRFVLQSDTSEVIRFDRSYDYPDNRDASAGTGYDGQFSYYIALDPAKARHYLDLPGYRYTRILQPIAARTLAAGDPDLVPWALLLVNWLAIGLGTLALAAWLKRRSCSPWWGAIYGFYPGLLVALQRDLTEPLAYALVACGVYLFDYGGRRRLLWAAAAFALAGLTRQTTLVFPAAYAGVLFFAPVRATLRERLRTDGPPALLVAGLSAGPLLVYTAYLRSWIGTIEGVDPFEAAPFLGLVASSSWELARQPPVIVTVVIPTLLVAAFALRALREHPRHPELYCLLLNGLLFVVLLGRTHYSGGYTAVGRDATGVVVAAVLCAPLFRSLARERPLLATAPAVLALGAFPGILIYGFMG